MGLVMGACLGHWMTCMYRNTEQRFVGLEDGLLVDGCSIFDPGTAAASDLFFASPASPKDFERIPLEILKAGSLGTHSGVHEY